ncbi:zinc finger protein 546-like [Nymphalis io]|uniref:zinc finger protein 546-like n=1 Tax=Inachis io TaxID=171585 RepID=UPI00216779BD|nr:zinc finger protein 546-like [Nymphalis io]
MNSTTMSRQVDVKALVSHVVRGDGVNRCRICMGDTTEGQVHLSDTVIMDGEKPVTLSELLETVTGIQMQLDTDGDLPAGICPECSKCALNAAEFRTLCHHAIKQWDLTIQLLQNLPGQCNDKIKTMFAIIDQSQMIIINDDMSEDSFGTNSAAQRLTAHVKPKTIVNKKDNNLSFCKCPNCGKEFQYSHQLSHHLKESTDMKRACHICSEIMLRNDLVSHMLDVHKKNPYDCKKCPALLYSHNQYIRHLTKAHTRGACTCIECGRNFQSSNAYHAHVSVHRPKSCPSCDKMFRNQTCYVHHVKECCNLDKNREDTHHTKNKVTVDVMNENSKKNIKVGLRGSAAKECICDHCGKKFAGKKFVAAHIQIVHMKNTHRPCVYCGKFLAAAHMTQHVKKHETDPSYTCQHCSIVLKTRLGYIQHLRLHTGERPYACDTCGESFSASSRRSEHIRKVHKSSGIILKQACHLCPAKFRLPYRLKKHLKAVHNDEGDSSLSQYECKVCHDKFGSYRGLLHHSRKHQTITIPNPSVMFKVYSDVEEEIELPAGLCCNCTNSAISGWQFRQLCLESNRNWMKTTLLLSKTKIQPTNKDKTIFIGFNTLIRDNIENKHTTDAVDRLNTLIGSKKKTRSKYKKNDISNIYMCKDCGKDFTVPYFLNRHLLSTKKRACTLCGKILPRERLARHLNRVHAKFVLNCDICEKLFDEQLELEKHKILLHGDGSYQCKTCKNGFKNERSLRAHMYTHTLFNCSSCNASFENRKCYTHHRKICDGSKHTTEGIYECDECGNIYTKKPSLKVHIVQKHLNVLPYVCQICGKRSSTKNHHKAHELIHKTERKVYQCFCGAKMLTELGFNMHQRIHSGEKPYECGVCGDRFLSASRRLDHIKRRHRSKEMAHGCDQCEARFPQEEYLFPKGFCSDCTRVAIASYEFRVFVRKSEKLWTNCIESLQTVPTLITSQKSIYAIVRNNLLIHTVSNFEGNAKDLLNHLTNRFVARKILIERKPRHPRHPRTGPSCSCTDCGKSFLSPYYLNMHLRNSGQKEACWLCGAMVIRGKEMHEHMSKIHKTDMFLCTECPMLFKSELERKRHIKKCHGPGVLTCADCGRTFQRPGSFEVHSQMHAVRTCRACGAQFANRGCYREHRSKCEPNAKPDLKTIPRNKRSNIRDPATFTCDYCNKTYHSRPQLKNHILWIHMDIRPHQCQWCGKRFYTPARLAEHSVVHTRVRNFECDICGAKLVSKMAAVYHRRRHTGERPYECQDCGEKFISSSRRSEHAKRRHNRGSRLQCTECHASFVRNHELKKHMDKVHNPDNHLLVKIKKEKFFPIATTQKL